MDQPCRPRAAQITTSDAGNDPTPRLLVVLKRVDGKREIEKYFRLPEEFGAVSTASGTCAFCVKLSDIPGGLSENQLGQFLLARGRELFPIAAPSETTQ